MRASGFAAAALALLLAGPALVQQSGAQQSGTPAPGTAPSGANAVAGSTLPGFTPDLGAGAMTSGGGPVEIDASEGVEWNQEQKVYIARGNARAARGDTSISADSLIAHYRGDATGRTDIYMVEAVGHVVVLSKDSRIVGDKAVYNLDTGSAILTGSGLKASSKDQYVTARDSMEYWEKQNAVIARGNAVAVNAQQQVKADMLTGYFRADNTGTKKLYQLEGVGNVVITGKGSVVRAAKAVYNMDSDIATLEGGVKISRGKNQINGEHAIYNMRTGQAKMSGGGGQVKTLLVPGGDAGNPLKP
ncbi:MAG TPA: LptA/OstA family protein [Candidatus Polarisedimenticolia bacterium]|nr:LptA/OstA family protein [Candidatus Polarisedimenticolia bacterium]